MATLWRVIERTAAILGIAGFALSLWAIVRVREVSDLVERAAQWRTLEFALEQPADGTATESHLIDITGSIRYEQLRQPTVPSVRLQLASSQIQVLPMVRPVSEPLRWWPQPEPAIADNGSFRGTIRAGREKEPDLGIYEIVVLAVPSGSVSQTDTYEVLPAHYAESNIVRVQRNKQR